MGKFEDLTGLSFTRLTVVRRAPNRGKLTRWGCLCSCGAVVVVDAGKLKSLHTRSCGCLHTEQLRLRSGIHGLSGTKAYSAWRNAIRRCHKEGHRQYPSYGARGIKVCSRWQDFENFYADMGEPAPGLSLDRINNDSDYEPGNCRWATPETQAGNRRCTLRLALDGVTRTASEWAKLLGIPYPTILGRLKRGWAPDKVLAARKFTRHRRYEYA